MSSRQSRTESGFQEPAKAAKNATVANCYAADVWLRLRTITSLHLLNLFALRLSIVKEKTLAFGLALFIQNIPVSRKCYIGSSTSKYRPLSPLTLTSNTGLMLQSDAMKDSILVTDTGESD